VLRTLRASRGRGSPLNVRHTSIGYFQSLITPEKLLRQLRSRVPELVYELHTFPSGAFMVEIDVRGKAYVVEFLPGMGLGVSNRDRAVFGWEGVDTAFETVDGVVECISKLQQSGRG